MAAGLHAESTEDNDFAEFEDIDDGKFTLKATYFDSKKTLLTYELFFDPSHGHR